MIENISYDSVMVSVEMEQEAIQNQVIKIVEGSVNRYESIKRQLISAIIAPFKGAAYVILLPPIGVFVIFLIGARKLVVVLQVLWGFMGTVRSSDNPRRAFR